jgi:Zn-dependent protease with chaperone function
VLGCIVSSVPAQEPEPIPEVVGAPTSEIPASAPITEYRLPPDKLEKAAALYATNLRLFLVGTLYGIAVLVAVLWLRLSGRFRDLAERASARRFVQALIFVPLLTLTTDLLELPLGIYRQHLQQSYGLSVQSWGSWFWDWTKGELIGLPIATLLLWGLYALLRRSPRRWWLYGWLAAVPLMVLVSWIYPILVAPLFNRFEPLDTTQPELVSDLERVTQRGGLSIERSRMFLMNASEKVTTYNAYVTGIGSSKRVVVWDTTARDLTRSETLFIFGHEQGHYVLNHIWLGTAANAVGLLAALFLAHRTLGAVIARFGARWDVRSADDWASLPILLLIFTLFATLLRPASASFSRYREHQADTYGLEVIHGLVPDSEQAAAMAFQKLGEKGLAYPSPYPLHVFWTFSHPPIGERVAFALGYRPWDEGRPLQFFER